MSNKSAIDRITEYQNRIKEEVAAIKGELENGLKSMAQKVKTLKDLGMEHLLADRRFRMMVEVAFPGASPSGRGRGGKPKGKGRRPATPTVAKRKIRKVRKVRKRRAGTAADLIVAVAPKDKPAPASWFVGKLKGKVKPNTVKQTLPKLVKEGRLKKPARGVFLAA